MPVTLVGPLDLSCLLILTIAFAETAFLSTVNFSCRLRARGDHARTALRHSAAPGVSFSVTARCGYPFGNGIRPSRPH